MNTSKFVWHSFSEAAGTVLTCAQCGQTIDLKLPSGDHHPQVCPACNVECVYLDWQERIVQIIPLNAPPVLVQMIRWMQENLDELDYVELLAAFEELSGAARSAQDSMEPFRELLRSISKRPGMYVGEPSLRSVSHLLSGYCHAMQVYGGTPHPLAGWRRWLELRYLISHASWHWSRILVHVYGSDGAALEALPSLYEEFLVDRERMGVAGIEAELNRRLIAEYGKDWHEPEVTATQMPYRNR